VRGYELYEGDDALSLLTCHVSRCPQHE